MNKKITLKNRILSVLLTVIMVFSMVSLSVFAADDSVAEVTIGNTTTPYSDLASAFSAVQYASGSATVKLLSNVDNFYTGFNRSDGVQLSNSVGGGEIMQPLSEPALIVDSGASLTVLSGTITNTGAGYGIRIDGAH